MKRLIATSIVALMTVGTAVAATEMMNTVPSDSLTVTDWYKQPVYNPGNKKLGDVRDVLVDGSGKIDALIIGVGGFLGMDEKDVAVPFNAVTQTRTNNKIHLTLDASRDSLKAAPGLQYDKNTTTWIPYTGHNNASR